MNVSSLMSNEFKQRNSLIFSCVHTFLNLKISLFMNFEMISYRLQKVKSINSLRTLKQIIFFMSKKYNTLNWSFFKTNTVSKADFRLYQKLFISSAVLTILTWIWEIWYLSFWIKFNLTCLIRARNMKTILWTAH